MKKVGVKSKPYSIFIHISVNKQSNLLVTSIYFFFTAGDVIQWREAFSHWVPEDWPQYIAWTPALVLVIWQVCHFVKIHKKYCLRFGLVDNALLGMAKPRMQSWTVSRYIKFFYKNFYIRIVP